jgi:hypothetical protein
MSFFNVFGLVYVILSFIPICFAVLTAGLLLYHKNCVQSKSDFNRISYEMLTLNDEYDNKNLENENDDDDDDD